MAATTSNESLRIGEHAWVTANVVNFQIQRKLRSPNEYLGMHWREKHRESVRWQSHFLTALVTAVGVRDAQRRLSARSGLVGSIGGCQERRRVSVVRFAPTRRNFVRDDDNLRFCVKPVLDALKRVGLIRDDRRSWLQLDEPTQDLSADRTFWTHITVGPAEGER